MQGFEFSPGLGIKPQQQTTQNAKPETVSSNRKTEVKITLIPGVFLSYA